MLSWLKTSNNALPSHVMLAGQQVPLNVTRHHNARRITLRYDAQRRQIRMTLPPRAPMKLAAEFLDEKATWLTRQIEQHPQCVAFEHGVILPVLGEMLELRHIEALRGHNAYRDGVLAITCPVASLSTRTETWLKARLREEIMQEAIEMSATLGVKFKRISLRDTSSRWGSCSSAGNLSFSWRLVFAPREILSYIIAHEVAHLRQMNHSPAFWAEVAKLHPDYKQSRAWLTKNSSTLHRYGV
ncbi:MAG: M48 family metallopeptidase [Alphaproteobacteria bacterium]|nr:M48 family metallopeptidase [Alphaproteobacteria bacterium]